MVNLFCLFECSENNSLRDCRVLRKRLKKLIKLFEYFLSFHKEAVLEAEIK